MKAIKNLAVILGVMGVACWHSNASAEDLPFKHKQVRLIIGYAAGGGYDQYGRLVARYLGKYLPGHPDILPQNMPGAGSIVAANAIYNTVPKDGSVIGLIARDAVTQPLTTENTGAKFDAAKMGWLGTPTAENFVCITSSKSKVKAFSDLMTTELVIGGAGAGSGMEIVPTALNGLVGTKFKVVGGYPGSTEVFLAMERGEVDGFCSSYSAVAIRYSDEIKSGDILVLFQAASRPNPDIAAPFLPDLVKDAAQRQSIDFLFASQTLGRPFIAPPGLAPGTLGVLRDAFEAAVKDPNFVAEAAKLKLEIDPVNGAELERVVRSIYATPKSVVERVSVLVGSK
jgi:tripartite-type tricarboxylate transporter receptor subunit TctC